MSPKVTGALVAVMTAAVSFVAAPALADPGELDPSFGGDGSVLTDFGGEDSALAIALDGQGRIVAAGSGAVSDPARPGASTLSVVRHLPDGSPDPGFGGDGRVQSDFGDTRAEARSVLIDPQGRIVVAGTTTSFDGIGSAIALARFLPDGTPDPSFGEGGQVETRLGLSGATDAAFDPAGRIVVVGSGQRAGHLLPTVVRYLPNGDLDPSFGDGGVREVRLGGFSAFRAVAVDGAGRIVAVGDTDSPGSRAGRFTAVRLLPSGAVDRRFGDRGRVRLLRGTAASGVDVIPAGAGRLLLAGSCSCGSNGERRPSLVVAELRRDGGPAKGFGRRGLVRVPLPAAKASSIARAGDGRIVVGGEASGGWTLVRLTSAGKLDRAFRNGGRTIAPGLGGVEAVAAAGDGSIAAAGTGNGPADTDFEVRRYLPKSWSAPLAGICPAYRSRCLPPQLRPRGSHQAPLSPG